MMPLEIFIDLKRRGQTSTLTLKPFSEKKDLKNREKYFKEY
jgi:hypothetical protein